jgi:hypothetical protein
MTKVVTEASDLDTENILVSYAKLRLILLKNDSNTLRQVCNAKRMLKPCMCGATEDIIGSSELFETVKALEFVGIDDANTKLVQLDIRVNEVVENFILPTPLLCFPKDTSCNFGVWR